MYIVMEIQKNGEQVSTLVNSYTSRNEAESKFYTILAAAAISLVPRHAATLLTDQGSCLMSRYYDHETEE